MYEINENCIAIERGDRIKIIQDGGGDVIVSSNEETLQAEEVVVEVL